MLAHGPKQRVATRAIDLVSVIHGGIAGCGSSRHYRGRGAAFAALRYHRSMVCASAQRGPALREAKRRLRETTQAARDAMTPAARAAASHAIAERLAGLESFAPARTILVTLPFRSEWDARLLAVAALAAGKIVASPRVNPAARMLTLHRVTDLVADLAPGYRGIPEPLPRCEEIAAAVIDWVLVPGVAFDEAGRRLGYGGGYYDRLLPLLPRGASRVAGAFDVQIVPAVPTGAHDLAVDCIVTETRTIIIAAGIPG
jgi:5-formyltetrahydrofolate cyclo-ligase